MIHVLDVLLQLTLLLVYQPGELRIGRLYMDIDDSQSSEVYNYKVIFTVDILYPLK